MVPTGSISERSWRTRRAAWLRRLVCWGALGGLSLGGAGAARAEWLTPLSLPERPFGTVEYFGKDAFAVSVVSTESSGAYLFVGTAPGLPLLREGLEAAGTYYREANRCFVLVRRDGVGGRRISADEDGVNCAGFIADSELVTGGRNAVWVKAARGGGTLAVFEASPSADAEVLVSDGSAYDTGFVDWTSSEHIDKTILPTAVRVDGKLYAFFATPRRAPEVFWMTGSSMYGLLMPEGSSGAGLGYVNALDAFAAGSPRKPYLVVGTEGALLQGPALGGASLRVVEPLGMNASVLGVSMNVEEGGAKAFGFGMAIVEKADGSHQVLGSVPMETDAEAGTRWLPRNMHPSMARAELKNVVCAGAAACVFTVDQKGGSNVFLYRNSAGPRVEPTVSGATWESSPTGGVIRLDEQQSAALSFAISDADGDPLRVSAEAPATSGTPHGLRGATVAETEPGKRIDVTLQAGSVCKKEEPVGALQVRASDGLASQRAEKTFALYLTHTLKPPIPPVELVGVGEVAPGRLPRTLQAGGGTALTLKPLRATTPAGCKLEKMRWSASDPEAPVPAEGPGGLAVLTPPALFCKPEGQDFLYTLRVEDEGEQSNSAGFLVHLESNREPLAQGRLELGVDAVTNEVWAESTLNCARERDLKAQLTLTPLDSTQVLETRDVAMPYGTWALAPRLGCGAYRLKGALKEGSTMGPEAVLELPGRPAALSLPPESELKVRCGEQASTVLTASLPENACQTPVITWDEVLEEGAVSPFVSQTSRNAQELTLTTRPGAPLQELVGQEVVFQVTADARFGPPQTRQHTVSLSVEPFVKVRRYTETPTASETGLVGVSVELTNDSACGLDAVEHTEQLQALSYVPRSARFNGQEVPDTDAWDATTGTLTLSNLALPSGSKGTLTYVARPHLVGERFMEGTVRMNGKRVSLLENPRPGAEDPSCGCSGSSSGPLLMALGALAALRRRRG